MRRLMLFPLFALALAGLACGSGPGTPTALPSPQPAEPIAAPTFDPSRTAYGFFPSPPEASIESILNHFENMGRHADFILVQPNILWEEFVGGVEGESPKREDLRNQITLARANGMGWIFVVDPLNGLNRREFSGLPGGWEASFGNPDVRAAFTNFTLWIVREFQPQYLGLASEINTYLDAFPEDVDNYMSLYRETYDEVKAESPETQVFVTFQWDDLNNMFAPAAEGRPAGQTNWDQVEAFEPRLDVWAISSYPYFVFPSGDQIPPDYYAPLLERTDKPIAVAEGGWSSRPVGQAPGDPVSQTAYLRAIHDQLGERLAFWVYLLLSDFNEESYNEMMRQQGVPERDIGTLGMFAAVGLTESDGTPKPALAVWDSYRGGQP